MFAVFNGVFRKIYIFIFIIKQPLETVRVTSENPEKWVFLRPHNY